MVLQSGSVTHASEKYGWSTHRVQGDLFGSLLEVCILFHKLIKVGRVNVPAAELVADGEVNIALSVPQGFHSLLAGDACLHAIC